MRRYLDVIFGWDDSVGIATCYGLGGPGIESRWGRVGRPRIKWEGNTKIDLQMSEMGRNGLDSLISGYEQVEGFLNMAIRIRVL